MRTDIPPKLTAPEIRLLADMQRGYQLETNSLRAKPVLRLSKTDEVIRPLSVNRKTIMALEQRGLIKPRKGPDPTTIVWRALKRIT